MKHHAHELDLSNVEEFDEINGDEQLVRAWCKTHGRFEWHSIGS